MQQLGKNHDGYHGETIDIRAVLRDAEMAAQQHGWTAESFHTAGTLKLFALHRQPPSPDTLHPSRRSSGLTRRIYISTGIHGDEPAGPLAALRLLQENRWPDSAEVWLLPCLNPTGFILNSRENDERKDLNRDYRHFKSAEVRAHVQWLARQPRFDVTICLHEDWESHGFYVYELNPDQRPSLAGKMVEAVARVCPIDLSPMIEGREARTASSIRTLIQTAVPNGRKRSVCCKTKPVKATRSKRRRIFRCKRASTRSSRA